MPSRPRTVAPETLGPTITIGEILVEIMATTVGAGFLEPQSLTGPYPSGAPAIFIDQVARLDGAAGIIASVGNDDFGRLNVERLRRDGVDVSAIAISADWPTGSAFVRYRQDGARDFVFNIARSAAGQIALTPAAETLVQRAGHVHVMGTALSIPGAREVVLYAIETVRARGGSVSLDPNLRKELLTDGDALKSFDKVLAAADLLLPSGDELFTAAGITDEASAVARLLERGIGEIVLKRGEQGASFFTHDLARVDCAAFAVDEIDPTGAGDCFGATYLTCRRKGMAPGAALLHANAAGARNVTRLGPMEGVSTLAELTAFIAETPRR
ncbi:MULTISPECIES: sugar kinase [Rhizobium]|uniref:tagatose kinase n=1 Tax=Rhizobium TaxID=379 RepID=UPI001B331AB6|nr:MULTISPECIES: sugar kinase [Rhizobium]MBX4909424.1 sugar kinase [Rhizobium bangladeshense]MBX5216294.1 sugar kinase [Rhizobium sp. NLR9a]MBX5234674.1 sugar kinase [Rhizobium sp. NLR4a]MBX5246994.1 sugar kinase [Rhizobium sp. NLR3b]MBX5251927.1 sugar kinase [Rhizobium sp. NLR4b]